MRKLACFAIPFAAAIFGAVYLLPQAAMLPAAALCALAGAAFFVLWKRAGANPRPGRQDNRLRLALICLGLAAGLCWSRGYDAVFLEPAQALDGETRQVTATVDDWPLPTAWGTSIQVRIHMDGGPDPKTSLRAYQDYSQLKPGDNVTFTARLQRADQIYGVDSEYYISRGIHLTASADGALAVTSAPTIPIRYWPLVVSKAIKGSLAALFSPDTVGFMTGLLTGDKSALDPALQTALQRTGLAHVVAVSGLHVSFLAGLLTTLLGKRRRLSSLVTIGLLLFFAAVAGNSPSVLRAVYLQSALLLAPLLGREGDRTTSLSVILMLLLAWNPHAAASVSLQLSFAAVAGIYLVTGRLNERWTARLSDKGAAWPRRAWHKLLRFLAGSLATTLGAIAFTTPLMAYYFGTIALIAPVANVLSLWAVSDAFMGGLVAALVGLVFPIPGGLLAWVVDWLIRYVQVLTLALSALPFAAVPANGYVGLWLGFGYLLLVVYLLWRGEKKRPLVPLCACAMTLCAALLLNALTLNGGDLRVSVLNVGQGESVLFTSGGVVALVDCGGNGADGPGDVAADAVQSRGDNYLDYLVLTHFHADHANGVAQLMARLDVGTILVPDVEPENPLRAQVLALAEKEEAEIRFIHNDTRIMMGESVLTVYAPLGDGGANEEGLSVLATCNDFDALVTGDMNSTVEQRLVKYGNLPDIELLVVGHHGSSYSGSEALLLAARPEYAVISVGRNNYGHPAAETLERLGAAGCQIYRTDLMGTVSITSNP